MSISATHTMIKIKPGRRLGVPETPDVLVQHHAEATSIGHAFDGCRTDVRLEAIGVRREGHWDRLYGLPGASRLVVRKTGYLEIPAESSSEPTSRKPLVLGTRGKGRAQLPRSPGLAGRVLLGAKTPLANPPLILYVRGIGQVPLPVLLRTDADGRFEVTQRSMRST